MWNYFGTILNVAPVKLSKQLNVMHLACFHFVNRGKLLLIITKCFMKNKYTLICTNTL